MEGVNKNGRTIAEKSRSFSQETTWHGVKFIFDGDSRLSRRLAWFLLCLGAVAAFIILVFVKLLLYFERPSQINLSVAYKDSLAFPAVTICNQNPYRLTALQKTGMFDVVLQSHNLATFERAVLGSSCEMRFELRPEVCVNLKAAQFSAIYRNTSMDTCKKICIFHQSERCSAIVYSPQTQQCIVTSLIAKADGKSRDCLRSKAHYYRRHRCLGRDSFDCDFERDCPLDRDSSAPDSWHVVPGRDKTTDRESGHLLNLLESGIRAGYSARQTSPFMDTTDKCLFFFYRFLGEAIGRIDVISIHEDLTNKTLRTIDGSHPDMDGLPWLPAVVRLSPGIHRVALQATRPSEGISGVSIDNVQLNTCSHLECCVPQCTNRTGHAFPLSDPKRMKAWKAAVRREKKFWEPTKHSVVCKAHFDEDDYVAKTTSGTVPLVKRLKKTATPHIFAWSTKITPAAFSRGERVKKRLQLETEAQKQRESALSDVGAEETVTMEHISHTSEGPIDTSTQTPEVSTISSTTQTNNTMMYSARRFTHDKKGMHFYTGLEHFEKFIFVLQSLGSAAYNLSYYHGVIPSASIEDQFFITLVKLRQHKTNFELSRMFGVSEATISNIFITWINFMVCEWGDTDWWPSRDMVRYFSPTDFKLKFPSTRVVIDGTECPIKKPKEPIAQQATFSTYKNRNTVKVLVGASPGGLVSYVSPAYGGSTSDRQICERSELMQMCDNGDSIMADKGFNVQDLFESYMVTINIPTFFRKKNRLSGATVLRDRKIASKRVHIERIIGLAKTYKILKEPMNNTESALATQIIKVCFYLCNFRANIVPRHA